MRAEVAQKMYLLQPIMSAWTGNGINKLISFYYKIIAENNTFSFFKVKEDFLSFPTVKNIRFCTVYYILSLSTLSVYSSPRDYTQSGSNTSLLKNKVHI